MLKTVIYVSTGARQFSDEALLEILAQSRSRNAALGVTGMLLYDDGNFMQVLEGPPAAVDALYDSIARDSRHYAIIKIFEETSPTRSFPDWSMGFVHAECLKGKGASGLNDFLTRPRDGDGSDVSAAWVVLRSFARHLQS